MRTGNGCGARTGAAEGRQVSGRGVAGPSPARRVVSCPAPAPRSAWGGLGTSSPGLPHRAGAALRRPTRAPLLSPPLVPLHRPRHSSTLPKLMEIYQTRNRKWKEKKKKGEHPFRSHWLVRRAPGLPWCRAAWRPAQQPGCGPSAGNAGCGIPAPRTWAAPVRACMYGL